MTEVDSTDHGQGTDYAMWSKEFKKMTEWLRAVGDTQGLELARYASALLNSIDNGSDNESGANDGSPDSSHGL